MTITQNLIIFILLLLQTSDAQNSHICTPSSCGEIRNISFPFRLKHDPKHCGYTYYELVCQNDVTLLHLNFQKYQVKAINYRNSTIKLLDVSINNNTCSFPNHSLYPKTFQNRYGYPYTLVYYYRLLGYQEIAWPINFISCPYPFNNSSLFTETTNDCENRGESLDSSTSRHSYIKVGHVNASEVGDMCRIDVIALTSYKFDDSKKNVSVSEIHESLLYGFELSWYIDPCRECRGKLSNCYALDEYRVDCRPLYNMSFQIVVIIAVALIFVFVGVSIPAKIILGITGFLGFSFDFGLDWSFRFFDPNELADTLQSLAGCIAISLGARFIIGLACLSGFLIYKFRTRHLSVFDAIETFLRSDNKLMPIRYSYSDIKKMTRGFKEELGQGGYGKVYKGKLRSGHDVAVKLLGKAGTNGQDFMNEIATIGRIHHVNVVKLVGYCAERSKRALVYDFMPNGSLDKYIYSQDRVDSLDWQTKFEIAIGVARGIEYLHRGCDIQILHFDIKPHNILLDDNFIPKISDFGLAKFYSTDKKTVTLTAARGTIGYVAPELINRGFGRVSYKADVYSFGMLLIEMACLKKDLRGNGLESCQYFPDWIYDRFDQGGDIEMGEIVEENEETRKIARKMTIVALWCIQMSPDDRPSMNKVLEMLEGDVERLKIPQRVTQSTQMVLDDYQSWSTYSTDSVPMLCHDNIAPSFEITVQDS